MSRLQPDFADLAPDDAQLLSEARRRFTDLRLAVVGDAILDCYRFTDGRSTCFAGGAAVIAGHLRGLGARPTLITLVGRDGDSKRLLEIIRELRIDCEALPQRAALPTRTRHVIGRTIRAQRRLELFSPPPPETTGQVVGAVAELRTGLDAAIFTDFGYGTVCPATLQSLQPILRPQVPFLAGDVSGPRASLLAMRRFDWLTPTEKELRQLTANVQAQPPLNQIAARLRADLGLRHLLVTRDREGCVRFDADGSIHPAASPAAEVRDEVGAGDALLAVSTLARTAGFDPDQAVRLGQWAAAAAVAQLGNAPLTWDRLALAASRASTTARPAA